VFQIEIKDRIPRDLIEDWLMKLKQEFNKTKALEERGTDFLDNIKAYIFDTEHFLKEGDYVKAWELVSFAWGLFEAGKELKIIQ